MVSWVRVLFSEVEAHGYLRVSGVGSECLSSTEWELEVVVWVILSGA